jgi:hypothetical protein
MSPNDLFGRQLEKQIYFKLNSMRGARRGRKSRAGMIRSLGISCLWLLAISEPALASSSCVVPFIRTLDNQTVQGTMYAASGKRCSITLARSQGPITTTRLVAPARNGSVSVSGNRVVYVSRPGYAGDDRFVYVRQGMDSVNRPVSRTVEVSVKVGAQR